MLFASGGRIATTGIDLAVCRDWVLVITGGANPVATDAGESAPNPLLTLLTTSLRRITLVCKLAAPLLISLLTTTMGYQATAAALIGFAAATLVAEVLWLRVVWSKFEVLERAEELRESRQETEVLGNREERTSSVTGDGRNSRRRAFASATSAFASWNEFRKMPVFLSKYLVQLVPVRQAFLTHLPSL